MRISLSTLYRFLADLDMNNFPRCAKTLTNGPGVAKNSDGKRGHKIVADFVTKELNKLLYYLTAKPSSFYTQSFCTHQSHPEKFLF